jgi:hypothetical protein
MMDAVQIRCHPSIGWSDFGVADSNLSHGWNISGRRLTDEDSGRFGSHNRHASECALTTSEFCCRGLSGSKADVTAAYPAQQLNG